MAIETSPSPNGLSSGLAVSKRSPLLERYGLWLRDHQGWLQAVQWVVVLAYVGLMAAPALAPAPTRHSHIWNDVTVFAQFAFWGLWWPFVLISIVLTGRSWCGLFCPEGALTEFASRHGLGRATPTWIKWKGWPFVAFACTTIYGQMISVYQYPLPVIVVLGGSTVGAMIVGFLYGRDKRVWCRFLCPVNGVFQVLAKLAPMRFRVDAQAWAKAPRIAAPVNCAPLVPLRTMRGASACHMCGRCAGFKDSIALESRSPSQEIVEVAGEMQNPWQTLLIVFGLMGLAAGAFQWSSAPIYASVKQQAAEWLVEHGGLWMLEPRLPWWILTNYPDQNDMLTPLDGVLLIAYVVGVMLATGLVVCLFLALAARALGPLRAKCFHHLAQALIPVAGVGVFLGLSATTVTLLKAEGLSMSFAPAARAVLLAGAALWSLWLVWRISGRYAAAPARRALATLAAGGAVACGLCNWILLFWIW